ncbi:MAG: SUF system NifU family Fe-S cluster assembly protein [Spirochaetia bacterium]|nr:SUF system NifU family Fe-S cluster assembly protein [Spirochaetia bacterium]
MSVDELYREVILDHFQNPRNKGHLKTCDFHEKGENPLCGDSIDLYFIFDNDIIKDIKFEGNGCSISQASVSMMTEAIKGKPIKEIKAIIELFKEMMLEDKINPFKDNFDLEDLGALEGVKNYPVRIKCALLAWNTLSELFKKIAEKKP